MRIILSYLAPHPDRAQSQCGHWTASPQKLGDMVLTRQDALIVDIFSSSCLMGSDEMGMPVAPFQSEPGKYHIPGCLEIAPEGILKRRFCAVRPKLEAAGDAVKVCLLPILRYVKSSCCGDAKHIINLQEDDFEDILMGVASSCRNVIAGEGEKAGLSLYTFDPVAAFGGGQKLATKTSSAGFERLARERSSPPDVSGL